MAAKEIRFYVPVAGVSFACVALVSDAGAIVRLGTACKQPHDERGEQPYLQLTEAATFLNRVMRAGMPWDAIAPMTASAGALGALIEAAENRRREVVGATLLDAETQR